MRASSCVMLRPRHAHLSALAIAAELSMTAFEGLAPERGNRQHGDLCHSEFCTHKQQHTVSLDGWGREEVSAGDMQVGE